MDWRERDALPIFEWNGWEWDDAFKHMAEQLSKGFCPLSVIRAHMDPPVAAHQLRYQRQKSKKYDQMIEDAFLTGMDHLAKDCLDLADGFEPLPEDAKLPEIRKYRAAFKARRLRIHIRMQLLAKWDARYGDKRIISGDPDNPLKHEIVPIDVAKQRLDELLRKAKAEQPDDPDPKPKATKKKK